MDGLGSRPSHSDDSCPFRLLGINRSPFLNLDQLDDGYIKVRVLWMGLGQD